MKRTFARIEELLLIKRIDKDYSLGNEKYDIKTPIWEDYTIKELKEYSKAFEEFRVNLRNGELDTRDLELQLMFADYGMVHYVMFLDGIIEGEEKEEEEENE